MKKKIINLLLISLLLVNILSLFACTSPSSKKKYEFTHTNGATSRFEVDFNNKTWTYQGICIWQTLRSGANYGKGNIGMTEKCSGTLIVTDTFDSGEKFYIFKSTNADVNWKIDVYVTNDQSWIECYISSNNYYFNLK